MEFSKITGIKIKEIKSSKILQLASSWKTSIESHSRNPVEDISRHIWLQKPKSGHQSLASLYFSAVSFLIIGFTMRLHLATPDGKTDIVLIDKSSRMKRTMQLSPTLSHISIGYSWHQLDHVSIPLVLALSCSDCSVFSIFPQTPPATDEMGMKSGGSCGKRWPFTKSS